VIGTFNFSESRVLAEVYGAVLEDRGIENQVIPDVGTREVVEPALEQGEIDVAIEYVGTSLAFVDPEAAAEVRTAETAQARLEEAFELRGIEVLRHAPGENRNEVVVTAETAAEHDLRTISDLEALAPKLTFGGPPECPSRPLCLQGLERTYNLQFGSFLPLDSGGPLTIAALDGSEVDAALLFTTNPALANGDLVALEDDRDLQPPENLVPVVRGEVVRTHGAELTDALDSVTELLTRDALRELNRRVEVFGEGPAMAAATWLEDTGLL
jgi:osmoprotectant transport system substrate-binding protein